MVLRSGSFSNVALLWDALLLMLLSREFRGFCRHGNVLLLLSHGRISIWSINAAGRTYIYGGKDTYPDIAYFLSIRQRCGFDLPDQSDFLNQIDSGVELGDII